MTMISKVNMISVECRACTENGTDFDVMTIELGVPRIIGNFLFNAGKVQLISPDGETLIIASPIEFDNDIRIHFAFGGVERRICHTLSIAGFEKIVSHLTTVLALAKLEKGKHDEFKGD